MTYQPPGGQPPEGTPTYPQPQDPWAAAHEHGLASMPTDPIPQQYDPYAHGAGPGEVGAQQTVLHGGQPYGYVPPPPRRSKAGLIAVVVLAVLVLGGGGGFAAWYVIKSDATPRTDPTAATSQTPSPLATLDPHDIKVGDCILNKGSEIKPQIELAKCDTPKSYKVIKKIQGSSIKANSAGVFDAPTTATAACAGTGFQSWYGYNDTSDDKNDVFFCLTNN
jgi:hypothetical protein